MQPVLRSTAFAAIAALVFAGAAHAEPVAVVIVPPFPLEHYAGRGAVGLMAAGPGTTVTRKDALAALVHGKPPIALAPRSGATTIYVSLPPPGRHPNDRLYPVAIVGSGFTGILDSSSTRIPGLVSIADIAPTAVALAHGKGAPIGSRAGTPRDLRRLDRRLHRQEQARDVAVTILALSAILLAIGAFVLSSRRLARAALLASPLALALSIALSGADVTRPAVVLPALAVLTLALSLAGGVVLGTRGVATTFVMLIGMYLVVLAAEPTWPALAAIGPNPSGGNRFYGSGNLTTSVLLTIALFAAGTFGLRSLVPIALLSLVTVGWSKAGADGGGVVVLVAAFTALGLRLAPGRVTGRMVALAAALAVAVAFAFVGIDAATGGSSHVTRRVGHGPGPLLDELRHRLHTSVETLGTEWHAALVFTISIVALGVLFTRWPRFAVGDALLVGIAVSLVVNDSPQPVAAAGAISYGVLWVHERFV